MYFGFWRTYMLHDCTLLNKNRMEVNDHPPWKNQMDIIQTYTESKAGRREKLNHDAKLCQCAVCKADGATD